MTEFDLGLSVALGIGLAAATGLRLFLPMLVVSAAAYTGHLPLSENFAWLATPPALILLGVAAIAEILAYYIPGVDNLLDTLATPAAFVAGTVISAAVITDLPPMVKWAAAIIAGGGIAGVNAIRDDAGPRQIDGDDRHARQSGRRDGGARRLAHRLAAGAGRAAVHGGGDHRIALARDPLASAALRQTASLVTQKPAQSLEAARHRPCAAPCCGFDRRGARGGDVMQLGFSLL